MPDRVVILSPTDLKPGTVSPQGKVIHYSRMHYGDPKFIVVQVVYTDETIDAFSWPNGAGWTVDGNVG